MKPIVIVCLGLISVLAVACGGEEATQPPATVTATVQATLTEPQPTPAPTAPNPGYTIGGFVLDSSKTGLLGGRVTLEASGVSAVADVINVLNQVPADQIPGREYIPNQNRFVLGR